MCTVDDPNRTVVSRTRVEMQTESKHLLEDSGRRLYMRNTGFLGPRSVASHIDPPLRGDGEILMPDNFPVRVRRLVEEERPHRETRFTENGDGQLSESWMRRKRSDAR